MLGIRYLKAPATTYVIQFRRGQPVRQGEGLSFFYFAPTSVISLVPVASTDVPFAFREGTADFQDVTIQGALTHRVVQPLQLAKMLDYSVDARQRRLSDDPARLNERLVQTVQTAAREFVQRRPLRDVLNASTALAESVAVELPEAPAVRQLGVEILGVAITSIQADPEMAKALQAEAREQLLKAADEAIFDRRNTAVKLERSIRENELQTDIAVAEKRGQVRKTELSAEIDAEQQRTALVETRVRNEKQEADARGEALRLLLAPVRELDWRVLMAVQGAAQPGTLISSAFEQLASNVSKIGELNISPDLLKSLLKPPQE